MTRVGLALLTVVGGACLALGCSGSSPRDQSFGTDAGSGFVPPPPSVEASADDTTSGEVGGAGGEDGDTGAGGTAGGSAGAGTPSSDADTDAVSDGGAG
jgi:hypothetical protein